MPSFHSQHCKVMDEVANHSGRISVERRDSMPEAMASALVSRVCMLFNTLLCTFVDPRCLIQRDSSSRPARRAVSLRCSSSSVSAVVELRSSMMSCPVWVGWAYWLVVIAFSSSCTSSGRVIPRTLHKSRSCTMSSLRVPFSTSLMNDWGRSSAFEHSTCVRPAAFR